MDFAAARHCWGVVLVLAGLAAAPARAGFDLACVGDCDGDGEVVVAELLTGVRQSLLGATGACPRVDRDGDGAVTVDELVVAVSFALEGCPPPQVPFSVETRDGAAVVAPLTALDGGRVYAVVITTAATDSSGRRLRADAAFVAARGAPQVPGDGPVALFATDPEAVGNPYPDGRLVRGGGVHIPDAFALRGLDDTPELATARAVLRTTADAVGAAGAFSTTAPIRFPLSRSAYPGPGSVRFFARRDGRLDLEPVLRQLEREGVPRASVAVAVSFPTQAVEDALHAVRGQLDARGATLRVTFDDPDPGDALPIGVFAGRAAGEFGAFLAATPEVAAVARGLFASPSFRAADGLFTPATDAFEDQPLDFLLTLPRTPPPHPVVVLQHGFGGDSRFVLTFAGELAHRGFAAIGIDAVSHGRRGSPLALLQATPLQVRDIFRQTVADQMALVRAVGTGIDTDGDGAADLDGAVIRYLGVSLGGILGATLVAVDPRLPTAVLTVAGGRVAFLGDNPGTRPIYSAALAEQAMLDAGSAAFEVFRQRMLELGQQALDAADPLNFARRWRLAPSPGFVPRRVLLQEGIGDLLVSNASTEALALAGGLPIDTLADDPAGVAGLWRFEPPGGHGILARADVRAQALEFLASDGTRIIDGAACGAVACSAAPGLR